MALKIASVTVSWNGRTFLAEQMPLLLSQTYVLSEVIVVDNGSDDQSVEFLNREFPSVKVIRLTSNEGISGGYCAGLEYVLEYDFDWVWMLDQDSHPKIDTLEQLLVEYRELTQSQDVGLIAPLPVDAATGKPYAVFAWRNGQISIPVTEEAGNVVMADMVISSGSLVRCDAIRRVGLPRKDLFIDFVDYEHCLRLRRGGFLIAVVKRCVMPHTIGQPRTVRFLGCSLAWITHKPWRDYYKVRNRAFVVWHIAPSLRTKAFVIRQFVKQALGSILFDSNKLVRLRYMLLGLRDGISGRLGIRVNPS